jgi:hypothetical protein
MAFSVGRREFLSVLGGTASMCPLATRGQQVTMPVVGLLAAPSAASYVIE